jgi:hypothetical protein
MVKKTLLAPFVHLLWFFLSFAVVLFFLLVHGASLATVPDASVPDYTLILFPALWRSLVISMPVSLFLVIFFIRSGRNHRLLTGLLVLITSTFIYGLVFRGFDTFIPYEELPRQRAPLVPFEEFRFHTLPEGVLYPFHVDLQGNTGPALFAAYEGEPRLERFDAFSFSDGMLRSAEGSLVLQVRPANPVVDPVMVPPSILVSLSRDVHSYRLLLNRALKPGLLYFGLLLVAQGWFCIQCWVVIRAATWPFVNLFLATGLYLLFMKAHTFALGELWERLVLHLPVDLPSVPLFSAVLVILSLPLFFWNLFSRSGAAGHE